jgi:AraC family transcriptional regulator
MAHPITVRELFRSRSAVISDVVCLHGRGGRGPEEASPAFAIAFPRRGIYRRHGPGGESLADGNHALVFRAGQPYRVSHPLDGGDETTVFAFSADAAGAAHPPSLAVPMFLLEPRLTARVERLHGLAGERGGYEIEADELALAILDEAAAAPRREEPSRARRRADNVREMLAARMGERLTLDRIADEAGSSPYHLARSFRAATGLPIHRYLNRLRLREALRRVVDGASDLAAVALEVGFASHSHFTDAFRKEFAAPPSRFRRMRKIPEA